MTTDYFNRSWSRRIKEMAKHIPVSASVMDLGCGQMELKKHLTLNEYFPVDYIARQSEIIICDFNKKQFPDLEVDICFVSGVLEYVKYPAWFIGKITKHCSTCIISYNLVEKYPDIDFRNSNRWINHLTKPELINIFKSFNWQLTLETNYPYFIFKKQE